MAWVYILRCNDGSHYTGCTPDLERRVAEHDPGQGSQYTALRLPVKLVYSYDMTRIEDAFYLEHQIKGWRRVKKEALIRGDYDVLKTLARTARPSTSSGRRSFSRSVHSSADTGQLLLEVYRRLLRRYGPQDWWPGDGAFEVCVGAILTQNTAWGNVEKAMARLREAGVLSVEGLDRLPEAELAQLIRSSGYFNTKARKLKAFVGHLDQRYNGDLAALLAKRPTEALREELLSIYGIGEETADDILLYAAGRPSFVVDAYTRRIVDRLGISPHAVRPERSRRVEGVRPSAVHPERSRRVEGVRPSAVHPEPARPEPTPVHPEPVEGHRRQRDTYQAYRALFMDALPLDTTLYNEYHALLVRLGKEVCRKQEPRCGDCPLQGVCETGSAGVRKH